MNPARSPRSKPRSHGAYNLDRMVAAVRMNGTVTRADLGRTTELSRTTVAALVAQQLAVDNSVGAALKTAASEFSGILRKTGRTERDVHNVVVGLPAPPDRHTGCVVVNDILPDRSISTSRANRATCGFSPTGSCAGAAAGCLETPTYGANPDC